MMQRLGLPKLCGYDTFKSACEAGNIQTVGLVCDGFVEDLDAAILEWREISPGCNFVLFVQPMFEDVVNGLEEMVTRSAERHPIVAYKDMKKLPVSAGIRVWGTLSTYDAFGVLVKVETENVIRNIIKKNAGVFLAHNSEYKNIRCFDHKGLNDRIRFRPLRIFVYRSVCNFIKVVAKIGARLFPTDTSWKSIR